MAIWVNPKKKSYTSTGPTAWLKRYVEFMVEALQTEVREKLKKFPIQPSGEKGGASINDVRDRTYDDAGNLIAGNEATGKDALAAGTCTTAIGDSQLVHGRYNIPVNDALHVVGNGDAETCSNAYLLDQEGNGWFKGNVTVGEECLELATKAWSEEMMEDGLKKKADITWIEPKKLQESVYFYEKLNALTQEGIYGLRNGGFWFHTDYNGTPTGEVTFEPESTEYLIVVKDKSMVCQWMFAVKEGMKQRSGSIGEDGTVDWEEWQCDTELKERVAALESVNQDLENVIELQENYIGGEEA